MATIAELAVRISADIAQFQAQVPAIKKTLQDVGRSVSDVGTSMSKWVTGPLAGAATGLFAMAKSTADVGDEIQKMAIRTGFSTETLSEFRHAADLSGTSIETMETGIKRMARVLFEAENGVASSNDALAALGLSVADLQALKPEDQFSALATALAEVEGDSKRAALAQEIFGRAGTELLPMLADGAAGIAAMRQEARDLGLVFTQEAADAAAEFNDDLSRLQGEFTGLTREIGQQVIPILMEQLIPAIREHVVPVIRSVMEGIAGLIEWFGNLDPRWQKVIGLAVGFFAVMGPVLFVVGKVIALFGTLMPLFGAIAGGFTLLLSPVGLVVAAVAAAIAIGVLLYKNWDEIKALIMALWEAFATWFSDLWDGIRLAVLGLVEGIMDGISGAFGAAIDGGIRAWEGFKKAFLWVFEMIGSGIKAYINGWLSLFNGVISGVEWMINGIAGAINRIPSFKVPDWVPGIGGGTFGLPDVPTVSLPRIPLMDTGGLIRGPGLFQVGPGVTEVVRRYDGGAPGQVIVSFNGPVYGVLDFEQKVKQTIRDAIQGGGFRGVINTP